MRMNKKLKKMYQALKKYREVEPQVVVVIHVDWNILEVPLWVDINLFKL